MIEQVLVSDVRNQIQRSEHCEDDDLNLLEEEFNYHLEGLNFVQIKIVLVQDGKQELLSDWIFQDPANPKANDIDRITLMLWFLLHLVIEELLINIDSGR